MRPEDGKAGHNFLSPEIHDYVETRLAEDPLHIEPKRLLNNLLSSQPMCFNLFAPLAMDLKLATRLVSAMPGFETVTAVTAVKLEYAPSKETMLNDGTSFDAWIEYCRDNGWYGFIGIETKLTEPFSQKNYECNEYYRRWMNDAEGWWLPGSETRFADKAYNQLWRNHLLARALQYQPGSRYDESYSVALSHPLDRKCRTAFEAYSTYLAPAGAGTLLKWSLDDVITRWQACAETEKECAWLRSFHTRYLDLTASEAAWQQREIGS